MEERSERNENFKKKVKKRLTKEKRNKTKYNRENFLCFFHLTVSYLEHDTFVTKQMKRKKKLKNKTFLFLFEAISIHKQLYFFFVFFSSPFFICFCVLSFLLFFFVESKLSFRSVSFFHSFLFL